MSCPLQYSTRITGEPKWLQCAWVEQHTSENWTATERLHNPMHLISTYMDIPVLPRKQILLTRLHTIFREQSLLTASDTNRQKHTSTGNRYWCCKERRKGCPLSKSWVGIQSIQKKGCELKTKNNICVRQTTPKYVLVCCDGLPMPSRLLPHELFTKRPAL